MLSGYRRTLRLTDKLPVRAKQPAQHEQDAQQAAEENRDERSEQDWTTSRGRLGRNGVEQNRKQDRQQKDPCEHRQSGLKSIAICHRNWPAYHSTTGAPKSNAAIAPSPRKTPKGSSICMFRCFCRAINRMPMTEPLNTPAKIVRIVSRQPR